MKKLAMLSLPLILLAACASSQLEPAPTGSPEPAAVFSDEAGVEKPVNTIRWTTASEVENFGFDVYRGDTEEGPFEVLTEQPLEGGGTVDQPRKYVFVDDTIDGTKAYFYYVESISMSGVRARFTPVVRAKAKKPQTPPEE